MNKMIGLRLFLSDCKQLPLIQLDPDFQIHVGQGYIVIGSRTPLTTKDELNQFFIKLSQVYGHLFQMGSYNDHVLSVGSLSIVSEAHPEPAPPLPEIDTHTFEMWKPATPVDDDTDTEEDYTDTSSSHSYDTDTETTTYTETDTDDDTDSEDDGIELDRFVDEIEDYRRQHNAAPKPTLTPVPVHTPYDARSDQDTFHRMFMLSKRLGAH